MQTHGIKYIEWCTYVDFFFIENEGPDIFCD